MASIKDAEGNELTASDRGLLLMLAVCGELTYLEKKRVREMLMDQYIDLLSAGDHPLRHRMLDLQEMIVCDVRNRTNKAKRKQVKPRKAK